MAAKQTGTEEAANGSSASTRTRRARTFPAISFKEALFLGNAIQQHGAGKQMRRLTLLESIQRSPGSDTTRKLITSSGQYGITEGAYNAEFLSLTSAGEIVTNRDYPARARIEASFQLAIMNVVPFAAVYERYKGSRLPSTEVLRDAAIEAGSPDDHAAECVETFLANAREIGLVRTIAGSEHLVPIEAVLEQLSDASDDEIQPPADDDLENLEYDFSAEQAEAREADLAERVSEGAAGTVGPPKAPKPPKRAGKGPLDNTCFVVSPIGAADSEERKHADLILTSLIEPALAALDMDLKVVRADKISKPGMITRQIIEHIAQSALVIADLSFGNPNVYYELALRHAVRKPAVQLIRTGDKLPFDVGQFRTVEIDMTDVYVLVPKLDIHRAEITRQARAALEDGADTESPLSQFYPTFWDNVAEPKGP